MRPSTEDIDYLLEAVNEFFGDERSAPADLTGAYAGVRPLISTGDTRKSVDISRKAELYETSSGLITITGGKLTTWRRMAKLAVDRLVERDGRERRAARTRSRSGSRSIPTALPRVDGVPESSYARARRPLRPRAPSGCSQTAAERGELAQPILPGLPDLLAEAAFAAATSRRGASATCCCGARGSGCSRAAQLCRPRARCAAAGGARDRRGARAGTRGAIDDEVGAVRTRRPSAEGIAVEASTTAGRDRERSGAPAATTAGTLELGRRRG